MTVRTEQTSNRYPASELDSLMHLTGQLHDRQCRAVFAFSGRLDLARLIQAIRLSIDGDPVLGCRFVTHRRHPYWERITGLQRLSPLSVVEGATEGLVKDFLAATLDASAGPQIRACLFRGPYSDTLAVKLSHEVTDGMGLLNYLDFVSGIYRELRVDPAYTLPTTGSDRRQAAVHSYIGLRSVLQGLPHALVPRQAIVFPVPYKGPEVPVFASRRIDSEGLACLREYGRKCRVSLGDVLLAAFYRALFALYAPVSGAPLTIQGTVDLRRYLPADRLRAVSNLTGVFYPTLRNRPLKETAADVRRQVAMAYHRRPWLAQALLLETIFRLPYGLIRRPFVGVMRRQIASGRIFPFFANFGVLDAGRFDFRDAAVCDLGLFGPSPLSPGCLLTVYTLDDTLTATICAQDVPGGRKACRLLDAYFDQLPGQGAPAAA